MCAENDIDTAKPPRAGTGSGGFAACRRMGTPALCGQVKAYLHFFLRRDSNQGMGRAGGLWACRSVGPKPLRQPGMTREERE